jgi:hypothetical protein
MNVEEMEGLQDFKGERSMNDHAGREIVSRAREGEWSSEGPAGISAEALRA